MSSLLDEINEQEVDYERDKAIDVANLHTEWLRQPELVGKYNRLEAQAQREVEHVQRKINICKATLAEARARLEIKIRKDPEIYDPPLNKKGELSTTEAWFNSVLLLEQKKDNDCIEAIEALDKAQEALIEVNYKVGIYHAATKAMADKKVALENAVLLWTRNYFAVPNLPRPVTEEYMNLQDTKRDEIVTALREKVIGRKIVQGIREEDVKVPDEELISSKIEVKKRRRV